MSLDASDIHLGKTIGAGGTVPILLRNVEIGWVRRSASGGFRFDCGRGPLGKAFGKYERIELADADAVRRAAAEVVNANHDFFLGWNNRAAFERSVPPTSDRRSNAGADGMEIEIEIETKTVALPRLNDPLGRSEEDVSRRLRAMAADALAGRDDEAAEAEAEAVARLIGLRRA